MTSRKILLDIHRQLFSRVCNYRGEVSVFIRGEAQKPFGSFSPGKTQFQSCCSLPRAGIVGTRVHTRLVGLTFESEAIADWEELHISEVPGQCVG